MAEVRMPKMGDGMEEGTINVWLKHEGDHVAAGDPIAEVETDKANVEISAFESGVLTKIVVQPGQTVPVNEVIAYIGEVGPGASNGSGTHTPEVKPAAGANPAGAASAPVQAAASARAEARAEDPPAQAPRAESPQTRQEGSPQTRQEGSRTDAGAPANGAPMQRIKVSPLARRMAEELGIDLAHVSGTGPGGRIVERDVTGFEKAASEGIRPVPVEATVRETASVETSAAPAAPQSTPETPAAPGLAGQEFTPSRMRKAIAARTVQSKQSAPHFYVTMVIEMDRALTLLKELNADALDGKPDGKMPDGKITVNDVIVKACAVALGRVPEVNATWTPEGTIRRYAERHIGVAVGIEEGLIIPVIRDCQSKSLRQISAEAKGLISRARANQLRPEEFSGGTFSVSNLGMMGVDEFIAIINPPEAAILAIGGIVREPIVVGDSDEIVFRSRLKVTLSADHRLLDGVLAARFLQEVKRALESPFSLVS